MAQIRLYSLRGVEYGKSPHNAPEKHNERNHHNAENNLFERAGVYRSAVEHIHEFSEIFGYEKLEHVNGDESHKPD